MKFITGMFVILMLTLVGCDQKQAQSGSENQMLSEQERLEKENPVGKYGAEFTLNEQIGISDILAEPEKFEGKRVLVEGIIEDVCTKRGCWIEIADPQTQAQIQVKVKDGEIVFPLSSKGHRALVEGTVEKLELTVKQARAWKAHEAEEKGETFDTTSITEPLTIWRIKGTGAEIKNYPEM
ncbi:MAG: hypothetical protein Kow0042_12880 [Calditrichia bacterium]